MLPFPRRLIASLALGSTFVPTAARAELPEDCPGLGAALVDHSCFHSTHGPFATRLASPGTVLTADTPNLDPVHTEYRVGLAGSQSSVTYAPTRTGAFSVFLGAQVPLTLLDPEGQEVNQLLLFDEGTGCDALPVSRVYELTADTRYQLLFGPTSSEHVVVVIEYVDDFLIENGKDGDGDPSDTIASVCVPPPGYVQNASDCDDLDATIHPGAGERCGDELDQNCNGLKDDTGLSCSVGTGACRSDGELGCSGEFAACGAAPAEASAEICNGIDDDCNGAIDESPNLCPEADRPTCVRDELGAFCGCVLDLDCGPRDSGRICDTASQRCVKGCSSAPGRNGCPSPEHCEEGDSSSGSCEPVDEPTSAGGEGGAAPEPAPNGGARDAGRLSEASHERTSGGGCGCRTVGGATRSLSVFPLLGFLALALVHRRRRRFQRHSTRPAATSWICVMGLVALGCGGISLQENGHEADAGHDHPHPGGTGGSNAPSFDGGTAQGGWSCSVTLSEELVEHACSHTTLGPYVSVAAFGQTTSEPASVSTIQTAFRVHVVEAGARLAYQPTRNGAHVLFTDLEVPWGVRAQNEAEIPGRKVPVLGCSTIEAGYEVELASGAHYLLEIGSAASDHFMLFIEHEATFGGSAIESDCE
jgi:MYXO-CTERM domain-containing protein